MISKYIFLEVKMIKTCIFIYFFIVLFNLALFSKKFVKNNIFRNCNYYYLIRFKYFICKNQMNWISVRHRVYFILFWILLPVNQFTRKSCFPVAFSHSTWQQVIIPCRKSVSGDRPNNHVQLNVASMSSNMSLVILYMPSTLYAVKCCWLSTKLQIVKYMSKSIRKKYACVPQQFL